MSAYQVDLTNCDKEPIHIPGKIQAHGFLVAVDAQTLTINYVSENLPAYLSENAKALLEQPFAKLEKLIELPGLEDQLSNLIKFSRNAKNFDTINPFALQIGGKPFNLIIAHSGTNLVLEFEPATSDLVIDVQKAIGRSVSEMLAGKKLANLLSNAAAEIKKIINYDRVMIYKFDEDGHGEVAAEVKNEHLEPFLGLHYPATDIPKQARELYKLNITRIIADVNAESSAIITHQPEERPLDLTHSVLRAVSPIHIQYLKNMGVASSFSISLIAHGELWGLVACHNYSPRFIDYKARDAAKLIGQILSSALEYRQDEEDNEKKNEFMQAADELSLYLKKDIYIPVALTKNKVTIQDITEATGVVLVFENAITTLGDTPGEEDLNELIAWLRLNMPEPLYLTHRLPLIFGPAKRYSKIASGIIACTISKELGELIIWFKPEQIETIQWAGNPEKPVEKSESGIFELSPRKSFDTWSEIVKNTSQRWSNLEIESVIKIREQIVYAINRKANEIRLLNERLQVAYDELDTFSYTISHDLRTPLTSIKNYTELLLSINKNLDDQARHILGKVIGGADKMNFLIKEILNYARVGRSEIEVVKIDMKALLNEVSTDVIAALEPEQLKLEIGETPEISGDLTLVSQVFYNLINNAVKYSSGSDPSIIEIKGRVDGNEIVYSISDNGVGIDINYYNKVFELFKRMDNVKDYEGTGVGLAIVKRIMEKHKGRVWFESKIGIGTVFYVSFKN